MCCRSATPRPARPPRRAPVRPAHLCRGQGGRGCRCHQRDRGLAARAPLALRARDADLLPVLSPAEAAADPPGRPQAPPFALSTPMKHGIEKALSWHKHNRSNSSLRA